MSEDRHQVKLSYCFCALFPMAGVSPAASPLHLNNERGATTGIVAMAVSAHGRPLLYFPHTERSASDETLFTGPRALSKSCVAPRE